MSKLKTQPTGLSPADFIDSVEESTKRADCLRIMQIMEEISGHQPAMWGTSIVGFGTYAYQYESGRSGEWFETGVSPRKQNITLYIMAGFEKYPELMSRLGKYKTGKSCLYIRKLDDIDVEVLKELISESVTWLRAYVEGQKKNQV